MRCLLLVLAAARVLLLLCCCCSCCCCCFDDDCSCFFTFGHISYWYDNSRASYYYYCRPIYLLSMQSPVPASSLAGPLPATSPQLGWWICQQEPRFARIRGLLLVPAAAAAFDDDCPCLFTFGRISYRYDRTIVTATASVGTGFASHCMPSYE